VGNWCYRWIGGSEAVILILVATCGGGYCGCGGDFTIKKSYGEICAADIFYKKIRSDA
jgi:hypothetical protein